MTYLHQDKHSAESEGDQLAKGARVQASHGGGQPTSHQRPARSRHPSSPSPGHAQDTGAQPTFKPFLTNTPTQMPATVPKPSSFTFTIDSALARLGPVTRSSPGTSPSHRRGGLPDARPAVGRRAEPTASVGSARASERRYARRKLVAWGPEVGVALHSPRVKREGAGLAAERRADKGEGAWRRKAWAGERSANMVGRVRRGNREGCRLGRGGLQGVMDKRSPLNLIGVAPEKLTI